ncbi:oligosaccharide flippase family protein [Stieleria sp. JC731]|uniref:lipopolysaccharide biosynthesis protein n=1 Tax=Pirellulaceae TaxID=2691357 RepID=UPI001E50AFBB|nr:oligosaccharide flippase family protein [Stieleria sp. JC731]MCC9600511.1 oligosaccharide flippase family protein [Stieleria sp. JC731]
MSQATPDSIETSVAQHVAAVEPNSAIEPDSARLHSAADTFSKSVMLIACLMIVQRAIGFIRSFYVCGALPADEVGQWDLAFNFLMLAAPVTVLGIPGSFGRFLAKYESGGQQTRFLSRTLVACLGLTVLSCSSLWIFSEVVATYFFGDAEYRSLVRLLAAGLPVVIFFNFATSWFSAKRLNRFVFRIQFTQTLFFALACVATLQLFDVSAQWVVVSYLGSCLVGVILASGYAFVDRHPSIEADDSKTDCSDRFWRRLLPFAMWVWVGNALENLFSLCDRMLLVNFYPDTTIDVQYLIGQYHTACVFPLLLMSIGAMAASTGMPYLAKDWEDGHKDEVASRMNLMMKAVGLVCLFGSVAVLLVAPILFGELWKNKFTLGEALLPMTLCFCSIGALSTVTQNYIWCIEKAWITSCFVLLGLVVNFACGYVLIERFGIDGVVGSTLIAHLVVLLGVFGICRAHQLKIDAGVILIFIALLGVSTGKASAFAGFGMIVLLLVKSSLIIDAQLRQSLVEQVSRRLRLS